MLLRRVEEAEDVDLISFVPVISSLWYIYGVRTLVNLLFTSCFYSVLRHLTPNKAAAHGLDSFVSLFFFLFFSQMVYA